MTTNLKFHTVINGTMQRADGRYAGWEYTIAKGSTRNWVALFNDGTDHSSIELARGVSFARARAAANAHHNHPGA